MHFEGRRKRTAVIPINIYRSVLSGGAGRFSADGQLRRRLGDWLPRRRAQQQRQSTLEIRTQFGKAPRLVRMHALFGLTTC